MKITRKETNVKTPKSLASNAQLALSKPSNDDLIREKAYDIYVERGYQSGKENDHWLEAEYEVNRPQLV